MRLLEHFKELSIHPKNAEELKGLILQLAIQGKLTKRWRQENPDVEPAAVLQKKISVEKAQLVKEKKVKNENLDPLDSSEFYFEIPNNWEWERLGNIGFIFNGNSVNKNLKEAKYTNLKEGYPYIATKDVGYIFDSISHDNGVKIPFNEPKFKIALKNTVLICSEGGSAGKKMGIVNQDSCFGNKLFAIHQYGKIESTYILSLYGSASFSKAFQDNMTGIIGGISRNTFASLLIPLPPLEEQKAIVSIVNQLFKEVEELELQTKARIQLKEDYVTSALQQLANGDTAKEWDSLQTHFNTFFTEKKAVKKLRESILQLAVQGKLTKKWRSQNKDLEPASELLKRIKAEKAQLIKEKKIKKEKPLPEITEEEIPYELPEGWEWCRLGEIIKISSGKGLTAAKMDKNGTIPVYGGNGITGYHSSGNVNEKTVVIGRVGYYCGSIHLTEKVAWVTDNAFVTTFSIQNIDRGFLVWLLKGTNLKEDENATAQPVISGRKIYPIVIAIPALKEQKVIVSKVNTLMALCDQLEAAIEQNTQNVEQLMQSCLREVFKGGEKEN